MKGKRVLVVEDNEINLEIMEDMLDCMGFAVKGAEHGKAAVELLAGASKEDFDVVLMDLHMPVMDGIEATVEIRRLSSPLKDIPILAMTGECLEEEKKRAFEAGMDGFITKPASMEQIEEAIMDALLKKE